MELTPDMPPNQRGSKTTNCPKLPHFHIFATDVFENENFSLVAHCLTPNEALDAVLQWLPDSWEGSIEIDSDKTNSTRKDPLIDFWRTPLKS